jgi:hypothetical protein
VMGVPPSVVGSTQVSPIAVALVIAALLARELGGSGYVVITAPLLELDAAELPTAFVATTVA